ncbi:MAG: VIT1/CCC1 transporter family protein [Thermoleophilia bacterium]|nr:VIT1/CCC1 transporter family protein [Thermoleophilia bacterium]
MTVTTKQTKSPPHGEQHAALGTTGWLRPFVLGAEDGIVSTAGLVIGVAAAGAGHATLLAAGGAGIAAGALSMAAGEYVSVAAQRDVEHADIARETWELENLPEAELTELISIYRSRGLAPELANQVAVALTAHDALTTHLRDELAIDLAIIARPWQAAWLSALSFFIGAAIPVATILLSPHRLRIAATMLVTLVLLAGAGALAGRLGRSSKLRGSLRVTAGGAAAMAVTWLIGNALGATGSV